MEICSLINRLIKYALKNSLITEDDVILVRNELMALLHLKDWQDVKAYMSQHRHDTDIQELKTYFTSVIDWISGVFSDVESEMRGIEWGRLFETYHNQPYDPVEAGSGT